MENPKRRKISRHHEDIIDSANQNTSSNEKGKETINQEKTIQIHKDKNKINPNKILKVSEQIDFTKNYKHIEVLCFECEEENIESLVGKFNFSKVPNVFIFQFKFKALSDESIVKLKEIIQANLNYLETFFVQFVDENLSRIFNYVYEFKYLWALPSSLEIEKNKFTIKKLFSSQESAFSESDYHKILKIYKYKIQEYEPFLHAINAGDKLCFRALKLFELNFDSSVQNEILRSVIKSRNFDLLKMYYGIFNESDISSELISEWLGDENNLFLLAVEERNEIIVKFILDRQNIKQSVNFNLSLIEKAIDLCIKKDNFEIYFIIKDRLGFLSDIQKDEISKVIQKAENVVRVINELHLNVKNGNIEEVRKFIENPKYFNYRICYSNKKYLLEWALNCNKFEIFSLLRYRGFYIDKPGKLKELLKRLDVKHKNILRRINENYMIKDRDAFLLRLQEKCEYDALSPVNAGEVREMLENLKDIEDIRPFLQITAQSNVKIYFDYKEESVQLMNPCVGDTTFGIAYHKENKIYVAKDKTKRDRWGTFAHELAHYVFYLIYDNNCLPYCEHDKESEQKFNEARQKTFETKKLINNADEIITAVFDNYRTADKKLIELAVRVPHLAAKYFDKMDNSVLNDISKNFPEIFDYHRTKVLPDLNISNIYRIIKINNEFGIIKQVEESPLKLKKTEHNMFLNQKGEQFLIRSNVPQLTLYSILDYLKNNSNNKLDYKIKNIFVDPEKFNNAAFNDGFKKCIETVKIERVFVVLKDTSEKVLKILNECTKDLKVYYICQIQENIENIKKLLPSDLKVYMQEHNWIDLTEEAQTTLKNKTIRYFSKDVPLVNVLTNFDSVSSKCLEILCLNDKICCTCGSITKKTDYYLPRFILRKNESFNDKDKKLTICDMINYQRNKPVVLISDVAGSGKTTFLYKVQEKLIEMFPTFWVSFIQLRDFYAELSTGVGESFPAFIAKILKLDALDEEIFIQKYFKGEVLILFDGFDEISPKCKNRTKNLFNLFIKSCNKNQIWITTRTHLESELKSELDVEVFKLKILEESEQIELLQEIWKKPENDAAFVSKHATLLVKKIFELVSTKSDVIGIPLILEGLAKYFKDEIDDKLEEKIENLRFCSIFEKIIDEKIKILVENFSNAPFEWIKAIDSITRIYHYWAVAYLIRNFQYYDKNLKLVTCNGNDLALLLNLYYDKEKISMEEVVRMGIINCDSNKSQRISFIHTIFAEFFLSQVAFYIVKVIKNPNNFQKYFLIEIIENPKHGVIRMFLKDMLDEYED